MSSRLADELTTCTYCGAQPAPEKEHAVPRCLYRGVEIPPGTNLLTVPACKDCNRSFSDDEEHFRNVMTVAGPTNQAVRRLWDGPILRSFDRAPGRRLVADLAKIMRDVETDEGPRTAIYPGDDLRVIRVVKKIVRGLSRHHGFPWPVPERSVWADVMKFQIPPAFASDAVQHERVPQVLQYGCGQGEAGMGDSWWLLTFFQRTTFIGWVGEREASAPYSDAGNSRE